MAVSEQELADLARSHDIISIGVVADDVRRARHGNRTTFVRVAEVSADLDADVAWPPAAGEIRITGTAGTRAAAIARVARVSTAAAGIPLSGFSLADLEQLSARDGITLRALLEELRTAGLELVAEAPVDRLQDPRRSIEEVNIAGLALARLTVEQTPDADPMAFLKTVAELQRAVAVVRAFAPLARLTVEQTPAADSLPFLKTVADLQRAVAVVRAFAPLARRVNPAVPTTGYDDVKRVALARIVCDNVASIQVDWARYGPKLAQVALTVGADDVDGVSAVEDIGEGRRRAPLEEIRRNIRAAGQEPVERNGRFDLMPA